MADRSVVVRVRAQVDDYKRQMDAAAKATGVLEGKADRAGKAIDREADAANRAATATDKAGKEAAAAATGLDKTDRAGTSAAVALDKEAAAAREAASATDKAGREAAAAATQLDKTERAGTGAANGLDKTARKSASASVALSNVAKSARDNRSEWDHLGTTFAAAGAGIAAGLGLATREAIQWESAWAGVNKTVDGSPQQMGALEGELRQLAKTLPATHTEIAATAEAAGQLGVKREDIAAFTKTAIDMGESTNLSAEEAATGLAQLGNVMGVLPDEADRAGAALVQLGNNGASTEADILAMSLRLAGAGKTIGATEADVLGLASGLANVGIEAEAGGSALSRVMVDIAQSVETGNSKLGTFAEVAGMSTADFAAAFRDDAAGTVVTFVEGLGRMQASGESVFGTLDELELSEIRVRDALLRTAGAGDMLRESLDMGSVAWAANTALVDEANKRYETSESRLKIARNQLNDTAIDLGATFVPMIAGAAEGVAGLVSTFSGLPQPVQTAVGGLGAVAGAASLVVGGALLLIPRIVETKDALNTLAPAGTTAGGALRGLGKAAGVAAGIVTLTTAVGALARATGSAGASLEINALTAAVDDLAAGDISNLNAQFRDFGSVAGKEQAAEVNSMAEAFDRLFNYDGASNTIDDALEGIAEWTGIATSEVTLITERFSGLDQQMAAMATGGSAEQAAEAFERIAEVAEWKGVKLAELEALFPQYQDALVGLANAEDTAAGAAGGHADAMNRLPAVAGAAGEAAMALPTSFQAMIDMYQMSEEATEDLRDEILELGEAMLAFVDPLGAYTGLLDVKAEADRKAAEDQAAATEDQEDSWEDYTSAVGVSVTEYLAELERQQAAQLSWKENMLRLAGRVSDGTLEQLARMGPEGAPLVANLVNASDAELSRLDDVFATNAEDAVFDWGEKIRLAGPVLAAIAGKAGQGAADAAAQQLAAGTKTIQQIASDYGVALADGVNPVLVSLGKRRISGRGGSQGGLLEADGGVVDYYAQGGLREDHVAQIAPAGAWRVWAENETGGEAMPLLVTGHRLRLELAA